MNIRDRKALKQAAAGHLQSASYDPRKLTLLHRGLIVGLSLLISLISLGLDEGIASTGGLSGIGARNLLLTAQTALQMGQLLLTPFWQLGILFAFLNIIRKQYAAPNSLLRGFVRFGPALRLMTLEMLVIMSLSFIISYISSFVALPFSGKLMELMEPIVIEMQTNPNFDPTAMMELPMETLLPAAAPILIVFFILYGAAVAYFGLRMRFADYLILDDPKIGAFQAMGRSFRLTKGNIWALIRLDLSFWLYYLLQGVAMGVSMLQLFTPAFNLPIPEQMTGILIYLVFCAIVLATDWFLRPMVEATYALAYHTLKEEHYPTE